MGTKGGKRPGAGRKPGSMDKKRVELLGAISASGLMPLDYMLNVLRDPKADQSRKDDMAKAAAPYLHPRLAATTLKLDSNEPFQFVMGVEELRAKVRGSIPRESQTIEQLPAPKPKQGG